MRIPLSAVRKLFAAVWFAGLAAVQDRVQAQQPLAGDLDLSFHGTGWTTRQLSWANDTFNAIAVQPDGKLVLAGSSMNPIGSQSMVILRLNPDGTLDTSFNGTGMATQSAAARALGVALRSDGRIVACGVGPHDAADPWRHVVASFLPNGLPDPSFGTGGNGFVSSPLVEGGSYRVRLQPDGKIVTALVSPGTVLRLHPNGAPDSSFGPAGSRAVAGAPGFFDMALQADGKIVLSHFESTDGEGFGITRLLPDGSPDPAFGISGTVRLAGRYPSIAGMRSRCLTVISGGRILVSGDAGPADNSILAERGFIVVRLLPDGTPDPAFGDPGTPGLGRIFFGEGFSMLSVYALQVQRDGQVLLAGVSEGQDFRRDITLARFTPNGQADESFGTGGRVIRDLNLRPEQMTDAVLLPAGPLAPEKLLVAGAMGPDDSVLPPSLFLARFIASPGGGLDIECPPGHWLAPEMPGLVDFGAVTVPTRVIEVVLKNSVSVSLTNIEAAFTEQSHPGDFRVNLPPAAASLAPGTQCAATISFTPSGPGLRTATLRFTTANDPAPDPRLLFLTGSKATPLETWRITWFGSPDNSGPGADLNDFDGDGLPNLVEYATLSHPHRASPDPLQPAPVEDRISFTYSRPSTAANEVLWEPEHAPSPSGPWSTGGLTSVILTDDGSVRTVRVTPDFGTGAAPHRLFLRLRVTRP